MTAAGHTHIPPDTPYPPGRHPDDHALNWQQGRVLHAYQIIYISWGRGRFESAKLGQRRIEAGTVFLLFPGVWHRYEPLRATGWTEDWIELQGPALDRLRRARLLRPAKPLFRLGLDPVLTDLFASCHRLARTTPKGYQPVLGVMGLQILANLLSGPLSLTPPTEVTRSINTAQARIADSIDQPQNMEELAESLNVSYSHLRRAFKAQTGVTLKQYQMQIRLRRVQDLLLNSRLSVKEIADRLGFNSPFHLSADFKRGVGVAPKQWRLRQASRR